MQIILITQTEIECEKIERKEGEKRREKGRERKGRRDGVKSI